MPSMLMTRRAASTAVALSAALVLAAQAAPAQAASNAVPTYEVKINLTSAALDSAHAPLAAVKSAFGITGSASSRSYAYYDTDAQALGAQGWDVRLRHKSGKDFEETYKKRFPVTGGDIDAALDAANDAGFDSGDTNYDAEVDWGYSKQTLSFSNEKSHSASGYSGTAMPTAATGLGWVVKDIPGKLADWGSDGWGTGVLKASRIHGPVTSSVYAGAWESSDDASIEVLPVVGAGGTGTTEYIVELSFKTDSYSDAAQLHADAISVADAHGWLYKGDILKTQTILDRY
ncbi:hypothetical protein [Streptomyces sp. VRA16 Mangrove soil]|uniref:hypothetical protein n=1 Tax=Streptomyces sp. VRA16 Mangrove soil TaxID=2817434 RepID=UPI001A9D0C76|nr:hypothetical protein [Streptomyces sp. VRA16 Mangrove soil]MBO1337426.1 hypothetical protein [Streptomyces sp. VRA16 Mangrove soil]